MRLEGRIRESGWQGVVLVAITYVYFLIFAQFAFLKRLGELGVADTHLKIVMAAMAAGGICFSLLAPRVTFCSSPGRRLQLALAGCGVAALFSLAPLTLSMSVGAAFFIGSALGLLTVTLVTHLPLWVGGRQPLFKVGLGTGVGYLFCNFPPFFTASPETQTLVAGVLCGVGALVAASSTNAAPGIGASPTQRRLPFALVVVSFTALVWLDSAAFFIIQGTPSLKAGTWQGTGHLWVNGVLHLAAALVSAWLLRRRGLAVVLSVAIVVLGTACLLLLDAGHVIFASVFYPVGVSLYSVALVAYPSLLAPSSSVAERGRRAGWIYAIAGWFGSAMGIGMGQNLRRVPAWFVVFACVLVLGPQLIAMLSRNRREATLTAAVLLVALCVHEVVLSFQPRMSTVSAIERGRQTYISEGCIHCHSQYVRPHTRDVLMWGPARSLEELRNDRPPLIGNRRQGPDLAEVGSRRSPLWLRAHFYVPEEVSHASFMPSYARLFAGPASRGDDLIAYVTSLHGSGMEEHLEAERAWEPAVRDATAASHDDGGRLFAAYCATCHNADGRTRERWQKSFRRPPPNLATGPWLHLPSTGSEAERMQRAAQIVKFGITGTDMPGHEYLPDKDVLDLSSWLIRSMKQPQYTTFHDAHGESQ